MSTMCKLSKMYIGVDDAKYISYLDKPKFMCKKCGRVANNEENLCRPTPLLQEIKIESNIAKEETLEENKVEEVIKTNLDTFDNQKVKKLKVNEFRELIREELKQVIEGL